MNKTWWQWNCPNSKARSENPKKLLLVSLRTWTLGAISHHVRIMVLCSHHMERPQGETIQRRDLALATVSPAILVFPDQVPVTDKATLRWADPSLDTTWVQFHKRSWIAWLSPVNLQELREIKIKWFLFSSHEILGVVYKAAADYQHALQDSDKYHEHWDPLLNYPPR